MTSTASTRGLMAVYSRMGIERPARHVIASLASGGRTTNSHNLDQAEAQHVLDLLAAEPDEGGAF